MQKIDVVTNLDWIKYAIVVCTCLLGIVNSLIIYIFIDLKKDVQKLQKKVDEDHDKVIKIEAKNDD